MPLNPEIHTTMQEIVRVRIDDLLAACDFAESVIDSANAIVANAGAEIQHTIRPQVEAVVVENNEPVYPDTVQPAAPIQPNVTSLETRAREAASQQATHVNFEQLLIDAQRDAA